MAQHTSKKVIFAAIGGNLAIAATRTSSGSSSRPNPWPRGGIRRINRSPAVHGKAGGKEAGAAIGSGRIRHGRGLAGTVGWQGGAEMSVPTQDASATVGKGAPSPQEQQERKQRVLTHGTPAIVQSIADAVVIKNENIFFLTEPDGGVPLAGEHGFGLYYHDCRYLNGYELKLDGLTPHVLVSTAERGFMAALQLTNPDIRTPNGRLIHKEQIGLKWERLLDADRLVLHDRITIQNFALGPIEFPLSLAFRAGFEDVYAVRGLLAEQLGTLRQPSWRDGALSFVYAGRDGLYRALVIRFAPEPQAVDGTTARFYIQLQPRQSRQIRVVLAIAEAPHERALRPQRGGPPEDKEIGNIGQRSAKRSLGEHTQTRSDSLLLTDMLDRSLRDLQVLQSTIGGDAFFAAGVPWFSTLFGRDSLITALQTLAYRPETAEQTLRLLARYQSRESDEWRDAQPGKILHELRVGEMARAGEIPHTPYYGTIDATPLLLILLAAMPLGQDSSSSSTSCASTSRPRSNGWPGTGIRTAMATSNIRVPRGRGSSTRAGRIPGTPSSTLTAVWRGRRSRWSRCRAMPTRPSWLRLSCTSGQERGRAPASSGARRRSCARALIGIFGCRPRDATPWRCRPISSPPPSPRRTRAMPCGPASPAWRARCWREGLSAGEG
jgi:hypothetical protein